MSIRQHLKALLICLTLSCVGLPGLFAATWISQGPGYWHSALTWQGGVVPPTTSSDTFLILTPVALSSDIQLAGGGYMIIDSVGGICGHHNMTLQAGAYLFNYGLLELDTLLLPGGTAGLYSSSETILTRHGILSAGGALHNFGGALSVGPWFNCEQPEYDFTIGVDLPREEPGLLVFPSITSGDLTVQCAQQMQWVRIWQTNGTCAFDAAPYADTFTLAAGTLPPGVYLLQAWSQGRAIPAKRFVTLPQP